MSDFGHEDRTCRSPGGDASIATLRSRSDGHYAERKFDFADLVLSTRLAQTAKPLAPTPDRSAFVPILGQHPSGRRKSATKQKSVISIFVVFVLLLLTPSCLRMRRTAGMRRGLERRGSDIWHPWSVSAIERCSVGCCAPLCLRAARIHP